MKESDVSYYTPCKICNKNFPVAKYGKGYRGSLCGTCRVKKNADHLRRKKKRLVMRDIIDLNRKAGQHWFSPDTKKFFKSKWPEDHVGLVNNQYFISSEKSPWDARKYSIRKWDGKRKGIDTVEGFGDFKTKAQAQRHLQKIIKKMVKM